MNATTLAEKIAHFKYCTSLTQYQRRQTVEVQIGEVPLGAHHPIRVQSMTTVDTMDTEGSVAQAIRMIEAGCEYVRITAPSLKEAQNLENIKKELRRRGYRTPLVADIHFTPNAAELAARIVEKVRINPGNYVDKKRFEIIDYTEAQYQEELDRIREKFVPLVKICQEYGTAMRIGTNHGSLSDRIMSRYGDTPLGMVESALEFLRICEDLNYHQIVLSMKASNTQVMVQAYRLLVQKLDEEGFKPYPLHLGVTEAGEAEDGRIKSAMGIGTLLEDGLGDTVRVSLTEEPEAEMPVGQKLVRRYQHRLPHAPIPPIGQFPKNPFDYARRASREVMNFGRDNVPRVMADFSRLSSYPMEDFRAIGHTYLPALDKWGMNDQGADYVYLGQNSVPFMFPNGLKAVQDFTTWKTEKEEALPLCRVSEYLSQATEAFSEKLNFLSVSTQEWNETLCTRLQQETGPWVLVLHTDNAHALPALRRLIFALMEAGIDLPVLLHRQYAETDLEQWQLYAATDVGGLLIDGLGDGVMLSPANDMVFVHREATLHYLKEANALAFGILQAARTRMTKTEYISCPSCGRTLFDLQETTAMIRKRTDHLKGVKIGIMGCIVNGPGEMADADYGYVGSGKGKITLYRGKEVVKRAVPSEKAVDELIELIKEDGNWLEREGQ
ncbi:MAG: 4-hydroxy-3-methylbut-2-en-1-yl diphosphate synthase [Microscillaceae bacterium]